MKLGQQASEGLIRRQTRHLPLLRFFGLIAEILDRFDNVSVLGDARVEHHRAIFIGVAQ